MKQKTPCSALSAYRCPKKWVFAVLCGMAGSVAMPLTAAPCSKIPESAPVAHACDIDDHYSLELPSVKHKWTKASYQKSVRDAFEKWQGFSDLPQKVRDDGVIEVWLTIPEINPDAAKARIILRSGERALLMVRSDLEPKDLQVTKANLTVFDDKEYPESLGFQAGEYVVKAADNISAEILGAYLRQFDSEIDHHMSHGWYVASSKVLQEFPTIERIKKHPFSRFYVKESIGHHLFEWIGWRGKAFTFPMKSR